MPPIHAREQNNRGDRVHRECQRQKQGNAIGRAQSRQDTDQNSKRHPQHHQQNMIETEYVGEAIHQETEVFHVFPPKTSDFPVSINPEESLDRTFKEWNLESDFKNDEKKRETAIPAGNEAHHL